ncbi:phage antirepressor KilAC domain-containing protein [Anaerocolumna chitinilytica]|uniref:Oxidoreductase n=1 Tax=Anaerocolumna chitinilytica TaxID=1727145 RepID=A0A7M3SAM4_9FIRM|nr:phage antirepressor KilAC domain-containing protein [Anaerocolumna chitinilytica]BCK01642.1 oxidoreductase [Anaerocolumna chitinilytica]
MYNHELYKIGDKARITANTTNHKFLLGEIVTITSVSELDVDAARNENGEYFISHRDITLIKDEKQLNELISINYDTDNPTVSARELYETLDLEERFSKWFERMTGYGFEEGKDYTPYQMVHPQNHQELLDYHLTIDAAKEICMLQRTEKGKQCRTYFIELEKAWNTPEQIMARAMKIADRQIASLREVNTKLLIKQEEDKPKVVFANAVMISDKSILIGELAKIIKQNGIDIGEKRLFAWMRENGYLIKRQGTDYNMPTQRSMELELFVVKETAIVHSDGHVTVSKTTKVTGKGQQYFINKFLSNRKPITK